MSALKALRQHYRAKRRELSQQQRQHAQQRITEQLQSLTVYPSSAIIAGYWMNDGEYDPAEFLATARSQGKITLLPLVVAVDQPMLFAPYDTTTPMQTQRLGIPEPVVAAEAIVKPDQLDLVITPLVAFDAQGSRLGMGGGFYDRSFAFKQPNTRPFLIGVAFEQQKSEQVLPVRDWDVALDAVVTEAGIYSWPDQDRAL